MSLRNLARRIEMTVLTVKIPGSATTRNVPVIQETGDDIQLSALSKSLERSAVVEPPGERDSQADNNFNTIHGR